MTAKAVRKTTPAPAEDFEPDAVMIRTSDKDGLSYGGFEWPRQEGAIVTCPDWNPEPVKTLVANLKAQTNAIDAERRTIRERPSREAEERAARERQERDERIAREATERAQRQAQEEAARAAELAEQERQKIERAAAEAEARAKKAEADRVAAEAKAKADAEAAARRAEQAQREADARAAKAEADRIAALLKAEREKAAAIEAERQRVADQQAAEATENVRREANKRHRAKINNAARDALVAAGLTAEQATTAIIAIAAGNVPNVKISY